MASYGKTGAPEDDADTIIRAALYARYSTDKQREASMTTAPSLICVGLIGPASLVTGSPGPTTST